MAERPGREDLSAVSAGTRRRILVIGSGTRFISGISYYTHRVAIALSERNNVAVVLMRKLIPRALYPGRDRVGAALSDLSYPDSIPVVDGVDWYGGLGLLRALALIRRHHPEIVILQWWTGAVLHTYILMTLWARALGAKIIIEFHEVQDTGEAAVTGVAHYMAAMSGLLMRLASGSVIHSESDRAPVCDRYGMGNRPLAVIPHGPFDNYRGPAAIREAPAEVFNVLFFGTIRPYKGLEDLVSAFTALDPETAGQFWLTIAGETWEGWNLPTQLIAESRYRDRITFVNRYLTDAEVAGYFAGADGVCLPYRRSSASGPLHVVMSEELPVIVTSVGGLPEAAAGYAGAIWVPPADPEAIADALPRLAALRGRRFTDPRSWEETASGYERLIAQIVAPEG
jgi:glycosyltransferase involved in cell wall biosynthesis